LTAALETLLAVTIWGPIMIFIGNNRVAFGAAAMAIAEILP
jgi:hypothetical protein